LSRRRCAFLRMADTAGWSIDADLAFAPLDGLGWDCEWLSWRDSTTRWDEWDAVYLAATWDYPDDPDAFLDMLEDVDRSRAVLLNPLELVRWNVPKTYLRDLEQRGADVVLSLCEFDGAPIVLKPVVSTNAANTFVLDGPVDTDAAAELDRAFRRRAYVVQRFMGSILTDGEYSLFYIGGVCSHAIRKVPKPGDFRVQEEHGSTITAVRPGLRLLEAADRVMSLIEPSPVYGRVDLVCDEHGVFRVMELELIEPSLYLRMEPAAPERFARALDTYVRKQTGVGT